MGPSESYKTVSIVQSNCRANSFKKIKALTIFFIKIKSDAPNNKCLLQCTNNGLVAEDPWLFTWKEVPHQSPTIRASRVVGLEHGY